MNHLAPKIVPFLLLATADAQTAWTDVSNAVHPSARYASSMVFDATRQRFVLFGGDDQFSRLDDTWLLSGANAWTQVSPAVRPPARRWHAMAYDSFRNVTVLFGGDGATALLADTWEHDGTTWRQRLSMHYPPARDNHSMTYDSVRHQTLLVGGFSEGGNWRWNGADWTYQPSILPARNYSAMAFDSKRGKAVLFGGKSFVGFTTLGDTWEYDGAGWLSVPGYQPPRYGHAMSYDPLRERIVMAGGRDTSASTDTQEFDGHWVQRTATLSSHYAPAMAFGLGRTCLFGGGTFPGVLADTRQYAATVPALYEAAGAGCGTADLHAMPDEVPYAGTTFVREIAGAPAGFPLFFAIGVSSAPTPLDPYGMPGCTLVPQDPVAQVVLPVGTGAAVALVIPASAALAGVRFYDQVAIVQTGANALGLTLSNAMRGTIQLP